MDLTLAWKSLRNRRSTLVLTLLSISLSTALILAVETARRGAEQGFTQSISQTDLIVGGRSGPLSLLLYTVFNMGNATNNISIETFRHFESHPQVEWVIPISLGDSHRGFRVIGTDARYFQHYRYAGDRSLEFAQGSFTSELWDVVIGSEVARSLKYHLQDQVVITHGVTRGEGIIRHDDKPFRVSGILKPTGTPVDQSVYVTLEGIEALHIDWKDGAMPTAETAVPPDQIKKENLQVQQVTAFFLRTQSRIQTLRLQREINTYSEEALLAIIPGVALGELWRNLGRFESALTLISWMVVLISLVGMTIALMATLNERRREMAILRAIGASPGRISRLLILESTALMVLGVGLGVLLHSGTFWILKTWLENDMGVILATTAFDPWLLGVLLVLIVLGMLAGSLAAWRAYHLTLKDGLSVRT